MKRCHKKRRRKGQMRNQMCLVVVAVLILSLPKFAEASTRVDRGGYWKDADVFVTEYSIPAEYLGDGVFLDANQRILTIVVKDRAKDGIKDGMRDGGETCYHKGQHYLLYMSDMGTKDPGDDIVMKIRTLF